MKRPFKHIVFLFFFISLSSYGQISPGDLTTAHAEFEGMRNCTLCHDLGNKVTNNLCLDCHKDIQSLITLNRGYHVSDAVKNKDCFQCHNEHHGRKFEMIRFDEENFDHELAGYLLDGKHEDIDCRKCHVSDFIADNDIKKRPDSFLGLETKCMTCHDDYHQETLSTNDCATCHDTKAFSPASNFNHAEADFILKGKHKTVDCINCHEKSTKNGKDFQKFNNISFKDCKSCHDNPHDEQVKGSCTQCHTETSFNTIKGNFNHSLTDFTLKGKHKETDCFSCHAKSDDSKLVFKDLIGINENNCVQCHDDKHDGKFDNDCAQCHDETSFITIKSLDNFDHNLTDYPLEGMHSNLECTQCHEMGDCIEPINFTSCNTCHDDYHLGEFDKNGLSTDCKSCHSLDKGFDNTLFTVEQHQETQFQLEGAHLATPCFACHIDEKEERWSFKNKETSCVTCHQDLHQDYIAETYYPDKKCEACHSSQAWDAINFDHKLTDWPLEGKHLETDCRSCHFSASDKEDTYIQKFTDLSVACTTCHEDKHQNQFAVNGVTDCTKCHIFDSWSPDKFDHNTTNFKLEGRHAEIACSKCHNTTADIVSTSFNYKIKNYQCIDCHR